MFRKALMAVLIFCSNLAFFSFSGLAPARAQGASLILHGRSLFIYMVMDVEPSDDRARPLQPERTVEIKPDGRVALHKGEAEFSRAGRFLTTNWSSILYPNLAAYNRDRGNIPASMALDADDVATLTRYMVRSRALVREGAQPPQDVLFHSGHFYASFEELDERPLNVRALIPSGGQSFTLAAAACPLFQASED